MLPTLGTRCCFRWTVRAGIKLGVYQIEKINSADEIPAGSRSRNWYAERSGDVPLRIIDVVLIGPLARVFPRFDSARELSGMGILYRN
jgi:hypothetical protein